ncbi:hypothetical protein QR680_011801 [Steinernema hermaphroditum]|uniref:Uncharacterized protein n=1 Tax=Steinernema hermaphroditum TaxID=289476 RepID=A0AA39I2G0_9BILA|nr:hypothetical protein QR680_011801 [Steinernema hermaphroditum]
MQQNDEQPSTERVEDGDRFKVKIIDLGAAQPLDPETEMNDMDMYRAFLKEMVTIKFRRNKVMMKQLKRKSSDSDKDDSDEEGTEKGGGSDEDGNHEETAEDGNDGSSGSMDDSDDVMFDDLVQSYGWSKAEANGFKKLIESLEDDANAEEVLKHN